MRKTLVSSALFSALCVSLAHAGASDFTLSGNATVLTDYRFRGVSQTLKEPAFQGGFDAVHKSGFYAGNWNSSISGTQYPGGPGLEMDFYAGYRGQIGNTGIGYDVGNLYYYYGDARQGTTKFDNNEVYGGLSYGSLSAKLSYATTDYFGLRVNGDQRTRGTTYSELNYSREIAPKLTLNAHVGYTDLKNDKNLSYTDYKLGVSYDVQGFALGANWVGADMKNAAKALNEIVNVRGETKKLYKDAVVLSIGKTF